MRISLVSLSLSSKDASINLNLGFESQFELCSFCIGKFDKFYQNSGFEVAHGLKEGRSSLLIGHLIKLYDFI